jgi:hypothetical protein
MHEKRIIFLHMSKKPVVSFVHATDADARLPEFYRTPSLHAKTLIIIVILLVN